MPKSNKVTEIFTAKRVAIPIIIGLLVTCYMLFKHTNWNQFQEIDWSFNFLFFLFISLVMMAIRDIAYMYRIRVLTEGKISWRNSFDVIMLWEFASAITPSVVGGSGVALFIIHKEGINAGKSTAIVMVTALLDELFYVVTVPIVILIVGVEFLFPIELATTQILGINLPIKEVFILGYSFILFLVLIISYGIFINPERLKKGLLAIFKIRFLKKWEQKMVQIGDDIIQTSLALKSKSFSFWIKAFGATLLSWTARFWVVNCLILAFIAVGDHILIYARQLVMWVILLISPTPGGTGVAELVFNGFLKEFVPVGLAGLLAVLWRLISYYPYLFIGVFVLPKWLKRVYG